MLPSLWVEQAAIYPDGPSPATGEGDGERADAPAATLGAYLCAVRTMLQHRSYPALQATERGSSRGNLSPLTVFWFLLYAQKERHGGEPYRLRLCKRPRPAARRPPAWSKISFTAFYGRKAGPAGRRILLCGEGRAQAGEGDLREVVAGLAGRAIQVHAVNGDLLPAGQGAQCRSALQIIQKG